MCVHGSARINAFGTLFNYTVPYPEVGEFLRSLPRDSRRLRVAHDTAFSLKRAQTFQG